MKILIIYASAGAGHMKAAEAVYDGMKKYTNYDVTIADALDHTYPIFKKLYRNGYSFMIKKIPWLWSISFGILDISFLQSVIRPFRRIYNAVNTQNLEKYLIKEQFDYIISTHFMPIEVVSSLKRKSKIKSKLVACVTDFDVHKIWIGTGVDLYFVASDWTKNKLKSIGISDEKIIVSGVPTNEKFITQPDIIQLKQKIGIKEDVFTVLIATGSFGIGPIEDIIKELEGDFQVIVVSGHNQILYKTLSEKNYKGVKVLGLVDNMHELMAVSDVMVTKPGGLSISEALVSQLPMIFFNPIPGQETNNIKVLNTYGIGVDGNSVDKIVEDLKKYRSSKDLFLTALKRTQEIARPMAVKDIIYHIK